MKPLSLIICATPRSGSHYLSDLLMRCGLPFGDEWLTRYHQGARKWQYGADSSLPYVDYLKLLSEKERQDGVFVLKAMYPQFRELVEALSEEEAEAVSDSLVDRICRIFPNPKFLFLTREDKLAQAISHVKARQTRQWVKRSGTTEKARVEPVYSYLAISQLLGERSRNEKELMEFFTLPGVDSFHVVFEELKQRPGEHMQSVFRWLGLPPPAAGTEDERSGFNKMATALNESWRTRFLEDREACPQNFAARSGPELEGLRISSTTLQPCYDLSSACRFTVEVTGENSDGLNHRGQPGGHGWLRIIGSLKGSGTEEWFQQELRPGKAGGLSADCLLPPPNSPGKWQLKLMIADRIHGHDTIQARAGWSQEIEFLDTGPLADFRALFPGIQTMPNGWQFLPWFGYFLDDKFPWVYHADHEWLYIKPEVEAGGCYHVLDANLGWVEVDPRAYPLIRSLESGRSWTFLQRDKGTRTFRDVATGGTFTAETNRPEHLANLNV